MNEGAIHSDNNHTQDIACQLNRLVGYLESCRQQNKLVTYIEVADAVDMPAPRRIHKVTLLLEALMEYDCINSLPQRAALVVSRNRSRLPANGFFLKAQALGLIQENNEIEFHQQCLRDLFGVE